jgi:hypothetical protein
MAAVAVVATMPTTEAQQQHPDDMAWIDPAPGVAGVRPGTTTLGGGVIGTGGGGGVCGW